MRRRNFISFGGVVLAALAALIGCSKPLRRAGTDDYYPLTIGSEWQYRLTWLDAAGKPFPDRPPLNTQTLVVGRTKTADGQEVMMLINRSIPYRHVDETSYVRRSGDYVLRSKTLETSVQDTVLVLPPGRGRTWHRLMGNWPALPVVFAGQESVAVAAGHYARVWRADEEFAALGVTGSQWFAPGVGLVREHLTLPGPEGQASTMDVELTGAKIR